MGMDQAAARGGANSKGERFIQSVVGEWVYGIASKHSLDKAAMLKVVSVTTLATAPASEWMAFRPLARWLTTKMAN